MEFRQLEAFLKVVELGSFSKAAKELHVSQPSVSTYISSLEKELSTTLLNRSTKTISTTLAGERFLPKAKELMQLRSTSIESMKHLSTDLSGEIRIIASSVPATSLLPRILAAFHGRYPRVSFAVDQADTAAAVQTVADNQADIGFAGSIVKDDRCTFQEFADEKLIIIAPVKKESNSEDSDTEVHTLEDLLYSHYFISRELGSGTRIQYEKYFETQGIDLGKMQICASMSSTQSIINSVANGLGISLVSELAAQDAIAQGQVRRLKTSQAMPQRKIYSVLNRHITHSHILKTFLHFLAKSAYAIKN